MSDDDLALTVCKDPPPSPTMSFPPGMKIDDIKREYTVFMLHQYQNNKHRVADSLGITVKTLFTWLHNWDIIDEWYATGARRGI